MSVKFLQVGAVRSHSETPPPFRWVWFLMIRDTGRQVSSGREVQGEAKMKKGPICVGL